MQLQSLNSVNFTGITRAPKEGGKKESKPKSFTDAVRKAEDNVHVGTVGLSAVAMVAAVIKGRKIVDVSTKAAATVGETVATAAVKAGNSIGNAVKKQAKTEPTKAIQNIHNFAQKVRDVDTKESTKMMGGIKKIASGILGEEKGETIVNFCRKNDITTGYKAAKTVAASAFALVFGDKLADKIEKALDDKDLKSAAKELEILQDVFKLV